MGVCRDVGRRGEERGVSELTKPRDFPTRQEGVSPSLLPTLKAPELQHVPGLVGAKSLPGLDPREAEGRLWSDGSTTPGL